MATFSAPPLPPAPPAPAALFSRPAPADATGSPKTPPRLFAALRHSPFTLRYSALELRHSQRAGLDLGR